MLDIGLGRQERCATCDLGGGTIVAARRRRDGRDFAAMVKVFIFEDFVCLVGQITDTLVDGRTILPNHKHART